MPSVRQKMMKTSYTRPLGETWKVGNYLREVPRIIVIDPFNILIQMRSEPGWFYLGILQKADNYNTRLFPPEHYTEAYLMAHKKFQVIMSRVGVTGPIHCMHIFADFFHL